MEDRRRMGETLPPFAAFPSTTVRETLAQHEWQACLDAWIFSVEFRLRLVPEGFAKFQLSDNSSGLPFLLSYFQEWRLPASQKSAYRPQRPSEVRLHQQCLLLSRRLLLETNLPYNCLPQNLFALIADGCAAFGATEAWNDTLRLTWPRGMVQIVEAINASKALLIKTMSYGREIDPSSTLQYLLSGTMLTRSLAEAGAVYLTGTDYLDTLSSIYASLESQRGSTATELRKQLTANVYVCFRSLMASNPPRISMLLDSLYSLRAASTQLSHAVPTLLSSLICSTTFLRRLEVFLSETKDSRGDALLRLLHQHKAQTVHLHDLLPRRKGQRGKGRARAANGDVMHIHKASQISQIQELFPSLSPTYILRLLDHFSNDIEVVTAALLEPDSLPPDLQKRALEEGDTAMAADDEVSNLAPRTNPPPLAQRRNVFDGDDFDNLRISPMKIHAGRKDQGFSKQPNPEDHAKSKAAILAALAAFDSDDDERDDTYDVADVGGTVDTTLDDEIQTIPPRQTNRGQRVQEDEILFRAWKSAPELFARDSKTRLSQPRQQIKRDTGMTDEQIEGWAVMLNRNPSDVSKLEKRFSPASSFSGQQRTLAGSRWQSAGSGTATDGGDSDADRSGAGDTVSGIVTRGGSGTGSAHHRGLANRSRGGNSNAGPANDPKTQSARRRKEQGRGRGGANHNRREGRAKKMAGGFASTPA